MVRSSGTLYSVSYAEASKRSSLLPALSSHHYVFLWRLVIYKLTQVPVSSIEIIQARRHNWWNQLHCERFSILCIEVIVYLRQPNFCLFFFWQFYTFCVHGTIYLGYRGDMSPTFTPLGHKQYFMPMGKDRKYIFKYIFHVVKCHMN